MRQSAQELFETVMRLPEKYRIVVHPIILFWRWKK